MASAGKILNKIMDKVDGVLFANGLEFKDECDWSVAASEMQAWVFKYYDDLVDGDEDYDPAKPDRAAPDSDGEPEQDAYDEESESATLTSDDDEDNDDEVNNKKRKRDDDDDEIENEETGN